MSDLEGGCKCRLIINRKTSKIKPETQTQDRKRGKNMYTNIMQALQTTHNKTLTRKQRKQNLNSVNNDGNTKQG